MITPTIVKKMEEEKEVVTFSLEKFDTSDEVYWLIKEIDGRPVDCRIVYSSDFWKEEEE